ncbi:autotransporter family protein [Ruegeria atlantica]|uniref:autotransporter family protein n=1 Tax=Ruegeria atlantica TaxID=81569 RepID=UPI00147D8FD8|nr:autotransporter outer membrane beta-barrel domain-containing protein [Ruegeria atlantica]
MSPKTHLFKLFISTSVAALLSTGTGSAQVIVDPGDTLVVGSGETINDQVRLFNNSTLQVESGGTVTNDVSTVRAGEANATVEVINNGQIRSDIANAIRMATSTLRVENSGEIAGNLHGIVLQTPVSTLDYLHNYTTGIISGETGDGVRVTGTTQTVINDGLIIGDDNGFFGAGSIGTIQNTGRIQGTDNFGIFGGSDIGEIQNSGEILGTFNAIRTVGNVGEITNQGIVRGGQDAIAIGGSLGALRNDGFIEALDGDGVSVDGQFSRLNNTGQIISNDGNGVTASSGISAFANSGTISGAQVGVLSDGTMTSLDNSGVIYGNSSVGLAARDIISFTNTGTISSDNASGAITGQIETFFNAGRIEGHELGLGVDGDVGSFENHGTITGRLNAGFENTGVISSFVNTGTISSDDSVGVILFDTATFTNSGLIKGDTVAFEIYGSTGTDLFLRQGSNIQGLIDIVGPSTLNTDPGMNLDLTFLNDVPVVGDTSGSPFVVSGDTIVVVDPTEFTGSDLFASDVTRSIFDIVGNTGARVPLIRREDEAERNIWISGFGGQNQVSGDNVLQDSYAGVIGGVDFPTTNGSLLSLFGGYASGDITSDASSNTRTTKSVFAGGQYFRDFGSNYIRAAVVGGQLRSDSGNRQVFNNLTAGGVETASSEHDGYFVSPSFEFGTRFDNVLANKSLLASLQVSYLHMSENGYTETGVASPITIDDSQSDYLNARAQVTLPHEFSLGAGPDALLELTAGIDGQFTLGDASRKATVLGSEITLDPTYDDQLIRGFVGGGLRQQTRNGRGIFSIGADGFFGGSSNYEIRGTLSFQYVF